MIINIFSSGMYEAVDNNLNHINEDKIDFNVVKSAVQENQSLL